MGEPLPRVLILDSDADTLITLQYVLELAEVDTTITWDETEAPQLLETGGFDLTLIGDHPPELDAAAILRDLSFRVGTPSLILRGLSAKRTSSIFVRSVRLAWLQSETPSLFLKRSCRFWHSRRCQQKLVWP